MAHNESVSFDPVDDRDLIDWLNQRGRNKSGTIKRALRFYLRYGETLTPEQLNERLDQLKQLKQLELLPKLYKELGQLRDMLRSGEIELKSEDSDSKVNNSALLDIMDQMDEL